MYVLFMSYVGTTYDYYCCYITFYVDKKNKMTRQIFGNESFSTVMHTVTQTSKQIQRNLKKERKELHACALNLG